METNKTYQIVEAFFVFLVLLYSGAILANEPNWPQFRGPGGLGIAPDNQNYPTVLDKSNNLLWKTEVPRGHSSPCIWGDNVFITARSGKNLETICIDRKNGEIKWRKSVEPETLEKIHGSNSHATPTPVCDGESVYVYFGSFGLLAYDVDGNELWKKLLPVPNIQYGTASSPVLAGDIVVITCDIRQGAGYILAVDRSTGETVWRKDRLMPRTGWTTPALWRHGDEQELVVHGAGSLISYDLKDGHKRWWFDFWQSSMSGAALTPVYAEDTLFLATTVGGTGDPVNPIELPDFVELLERYDGDGDNRLVKEEILGDILRVYRGGPDESFFSEFDTDKDGFINEAEWNKVVTDTRNIAPTNLDALVAIRAGGTDDVSRSHVKWTAHEGIGQVPSPLFYKGRIYLIKHGGNVTCYDAKTGKKIYGDKTGVRAYYFASPVAADDKIYFCSLLGDVFVVQAGDKFKILAKNKIGERIYATPALVDGKIYLRSDKNIYAFFTKDDSGQTLPDIVVREANGRATMLYEAAAEGNIELVKSLISSGADVNTPNDWGWTPLYVASGIGNRDLVNLLIDEGADVNTGTKEGMTPLHFAISNSNKEIVELLIEKSADINIKNNRGHTPLHLAAEDGQKDAVELLISKGAEIDEKDNNGRIPLHLAARDGQLDVVEMLITKGADINAKNNGGQTPLHLAARNGQKEIVELLITKGVDINATNYRGITPLFLARSRGHTEIVELLKKHGTIEDSSAGENGAEPANLLHEAAAAGDIEQVKSLISQGANLDARDNQGSKPLHHAAVNGHKKVAELLIENGADVNTKHNFGGTALHLAAGRGHKDVVELLIAKGADINATNNRGITSLVLAQRRGHTEIVELLKKHGAKE